MSPSKMKKTLNYPEFPGSSHLICFSTTSDVKLLFICSYIFSLHPSPFSAVKISSHVTFSTNHHVSPTTSMIPILFFGRPPPICTRYCFPCFIELYIPSVLTGIVPSAVIT